MWIPALENVLGNEPFRMKWNGMAAFIIITPYITTANNYPRYAKLNPTKLRLHPAAIAIDNLYSLHGAFMVMQY